MIDVNIVDKANLVVVTNIWTILFDGSKSQVGAGFLIIDHQGKGIFISCKLESKCITNTLEHEVLVQGLNKSIDLNDKNLKPFGDSKSL